MTSWGGSCDQKSRQPVVHNIPSIFATLPEGVYILSVDTEQGPHPSGSCWYARGLFPHHHLPDEGGCTVHLPEIMLFQDAAYQRV